MKIIGVTSGVCFGKSIQPPSREEFGKFSKEGGLFFLYGKFLKKFSENGVDPQNPSLDPPLVLNEILISQSMKMSILFNNL